MRSHDQQQGRRDDQAARRAQVHLETFKALALEAIGIGVLSGGWRMFLNEAVQARLERTPLSQWNGLAVLIDGAPEEARIMTRHELVQWCFGNALPTLAIEAAKRKVPTRSILALLIDDSGPRFKVL